MVRASFSISGTITDFVRSNSIDWVVINTGELYGRRVPLSSIKLIATCEQTDWIKDGDGKIVRVDHCPNPPEIVIPGGVWMCRSCDEKRQA